MISEGEETTVKIVAGMLRLKSINQTEDNDSMTGQRESEQAQIREDQQDSRGRGRQMSNFEPTAESTPFEKTGARELGARLLEISEQATKKADKHEELNQKINETLMEENLLKELRKMELQNMKERQKGNWDEQTYSDGWNQPKLKFNMEKATNKDAFKKYREREVAETTGTKSGRKYKETYKGAKMMPLLVKGTQMKYVPWGGRDVETFKSKLPSLRDGANRWIAAFEDETVGDMIAVGDIKVLLSKVLTRQEMEDILEDTGMKDAVGCEDYNGQSLNTYRAELWGTLRDRFPTKMSKNRQLTKPLTSEDNFDQWINEQVQHWRNVTNENVTFDKSSLCAQLFRSA